MAQRVLLGQQNRLYQLAAPTFTPGDEAGDHVVENLLQPTPTTWWRADDLTKTWTNIDLGGTWFDLVAPLYCTAQRRRNLITNSNNIDGGSDWSGTNCTATDASDTAEAEANASLLTATGAGASEHYYAHERNLWAYSVNVGRSSITRFTLSTLVRRPSGDAHLRLYLSVGSGDTAYVDVDLDDGSVQASAATGSGSIVSTAVASYASVTSAQTGWYRVTLVADVEVDQGLAIYYRYYILDASFATSYVQSGEALWVSSPKLTIGDGLEPWEVNSTVPGAPGGLFHATLTDSASTNPQTLGTNPTYSGLIHLSKSANMVHWDAAHGWSHSYWYNSAGSRQRYMLLELHSEDHADNQVDLSCLYVGPTFRPARNYTDVSIVPSTVETTIDVAPGGQMFPAAEIGGREVAIRFEYLTDADALAGLHDMRVRLQGHSPVLAILDADDDTYGQSGIVYGILKDVRLQPPKLDGQGNQRRAVDVVIAELLP